MLQTYADGQIAENKIEIDGDTKKEIPQYFTFKVQAICATVDEKQLDINDDNVFFTYNKESYEGTAYMFIYCEYVKRFEHMKDRTKTN